MIHLVIILGIGFLISRVLWLIFGIFQALISSKTSSTSRHLQQEPQKNVTKQATTTSSVSSQNPSAAQRTSKTNEKQLDQKLNEKISVKIEADERIRQENISSQLKKVSMKLQKEDKAKIQTGTQVVSDQVRKSGREAESSIIAQAPESKNWQDQKQSYEQRIAQLLEQIQEHRKEKVSYIQKIQEIIQHVSNEQELNEEIRPSTDDSESRAIHNLKHQLNLATQKMAEQKKQLILQFENTKKQLINSYEQKLAECSTRNAEKIAQYSKVIDDITQRVYELQQEKSHKYEIGQKDPSQDLASAISQRNRLKQQLTAAKNQIAQANIYNEQKEALIKKLQQEILEGKKEEENLKSELGRKQNDRLDAQIKLQSQINSLVIRNQEISQQLDGIKKAKFSLQQQLQQKVLESQKENLIGDDNAFVSGTIANLQKQIRQAKFMNEQEKRKHSETIQELKFCQQQLKNARDTESQLRQKLSQVPKKTSLKREDVEQHPEFIAMKRRVEELQARKLVPSEHKSTLLNPYSSPREIRQLSPTFANVPAVSNVRTVSPNSQSRGAYKSGFMPSSYQPKLSHLGVPPTVSTIMDRRYKTPSEKPVAQSSINEGGILGSVYLGETNILDEAQRNLIIHEISALKKITIRKTTLLYSSSQKVNKPITQYLVGVPNLLVIVELANKNIIGAFTQNAFSKANQFSHSTIMSKAMIFSILPQIFLVNENRGDAIHFEENILTWGKQEIVINCKEPLELSANLNFEEAVYPTAGISTSEFLGSEERTIPITKFEAYRNFFG